MTGAASDQALCLRRGVTSAPLPSLSLGREAGVATSSDDGAWRSQGRPEPVPETGPPAEAGRRQRTRPHAEGHQVGGGGDLT